MFVGPCGCGGILVRYSLWQLYVIVLRGVSLGDYGGYLGSGVPSEYGVDGWIIVVSASSSGGSFSRWAVVGV